ncbi:MAG: helix-hairpin-helix domain-containing protein [Candidatus Nealsonbacteria bacterium]|nr:helix-hairpin-helix domain-containing protein [Candidatus Nealsonbacteria bacterium]
MKVYCLIFIFLFSGLFFGRINFVFADGRIDINSAPLEDLVKIIHIGEVRASELISLRPFSSLDELVKIKGIGEARLRDIKEQGLAWIAPSPQTEFQPETEPKPEAINKPQGEESNQKPGPIISPPEVVTQNQGQKLETKEINLALAGQQSPKPIIFIAALAISVISIIVSLTIKRKMVS